MSFAVDSNKVDPCAGNIFACPDSILYCSLLRMDAASPVVTEAGGNIILIEASAELVFIPGWGVESFRQQLSIFHNNGATMRAVAKRSRSHLSGQIEPL